MYIEKFSMPSLTVCTLITLIKFLPNILEPLGYREKNMFRMNIGRVTFTPTPLSDTGKVLFFQMLNTTLKCVLQN